MSEVPTSAPEGIKLDLELAKIAIKLAWVASAMKANDEGPAAEIIEGITSELDALVCLLVK